MISLERRRCRRHKVGGADVFRPQSELGACGMTEGKGGGSGGGEPREQGNEAAGRLPGLPVPGGTCGLRRVAPVAANSAAGFAFYTEVV